MPRKKNKGRKHWEDEDERNGSPSVHLHEACTQGDVAAVADFISKYGVSVELDEKGRKPLWYACSSGHTKIVELILSHYPPSYSCEFIQEVSVAAEGAHWDIVQLLMEKGEVDVNMHVSLKEERITLLALATKQGNLQQVDMLLKKGAIVTINDPSPLSIAAFLNYFEIFDLLWEKTDQSIKLQAAEHAILRASPKGNVKIAKKLLEFVTDKQQIATKALSVTVRSMRVADQSAWQAQWEDNKKFLKREVNNTAEREGQLEVIKLMLDSDAKPNESSQLFALPLHSAILNKNEEIFRLLLEHGAHVNSKDSAGNTALMLAAEAGEVEMVRTLLEKGANLRDTNYYSYKPPIHFACDQPEPIASEIVSLLLEYGSDVNCIGEDSSTPLLVAVRNNNPKLTWLLRLHGASTRDACESVSKMVVVFEGKSTIWEICKDPQVKSALSREWTLQDHKLLPKSVRDTIYSFLLVARRMGLHGPPAHRIIELAILDWIHDTF